MNLIVATDESYGIAKDGELLTYLPKDLKFFKEKTLGNIIIMGRKTIDSLPGSGLLPGRETWILTRDRSYIKEGAQIFYSIESIVDYIKEHQVDEERIYVAGGGVIYESFLPYCKKAYITHIRHQFNADTWMPAIGNMKEWKKVYESEDQYQGELAYVHTTYERVQ